MKKITFCIPSKSNLRYLKTCIPSIRENAYRNDHEIIIFVDSDEDGTVKWLEQVKEEYNLRYFINQETSPQGIAAGYNRCIKAASTEIICMFHADMYIAKGFDINLLKHLQPKTIISATRIEPPLHPPGLEKIIQDFGMYPEDFKLEEFNIFVEKSLVEYKNQITNGIFAPWICYKSDLLEINLHDEYLHSYYEDSDIFNRMILNGITCIQSRDSLVYHLTCRGGQFQDGIENITTDPHFHNMKNKSYRHYLRKWGSWVKNDVYQHPIISPKYNIAYVVKKCNLELLSVLEPWCDRIYIEDDMHVLINSYIEQEQPNTSFDLTKRVFHIGHNYPIGENDVVIEFDATQLNQQNFQLLQQFPEIIKESGSIGEFELDIFKITISHIEEYQYNLIKI